MTRAQARARTRTRLVLWWRRGLTPRRWCSSYTPAGIRWLVVGRHERQP